MTGDHGNFISAARESVRRHAPLLVWALVALTVVAIPLKIIGYGYLPGDDALRHAAKAVSGKPWDEILVLGPAYREQYFFWHLFLRQIFLWSHCDPGQLVGFTVAGLFILFGFSPLPWVKRPEAWLITLTLVTVAGGLLPRLMLGRPFLLTISGLVTMLCAWQFREPSPPRWRTLAMVTATSAFCTLVHGVWYLWALPVAAFFLAGQFRWGILLATGWLAGSFLGACLTGHPFASLFYAAEIGRRSLGLHLVQHTMATEFQPFAGDIFALLLVAGLLVLRCVEKRDPLSWKSSPVFWLAGLGWLLGFKAIRFWTDWGWPALMVLTVFELQLLLAARLAANSLKRLALAGGLAVMTYLAATSNNDGKWTENLSWPVLSQDNPDLNGWLPDPDGIFYTADMTIFYQTFFRNPQARWRYIVGFEPALMPDADFAVYQNVHWNFGDSQAYRPWVEKMHPADRLIFRGGSGAVPNLPQLEWKAAPGFWIGRTPRTNAPSAQ